MPSQSNIRRKHLQLSQSQQPERGRSRTPKPMVTGLEFQTHGGHRQPPRGGFATTGRINHNPRASYPTQVPRPPPKGKSPDRSEPGALEDAIHEAHARGDLRQCLQWVLEMQGIHLDWDDPRLDTVTEDDLCFSEQTGMGPDATFEERKRAEKYWAMRQAEEDESRRTWELAATPSQKETFRRHREKHEAEQRRREARAEFFRTSRKDKVAPGTASSQQLSQQPPPPKPNPPSTLSRSLDSALERPCVIPRTNHSRPKMLFPMDEGELFNVRAMWLEQNRKGYTLMESLVQPPVAPSAHAKDAASLPKTTPTLARCGSLDNITASTSASTSLTSAPSALFSSIVTTTSMATSISSVPNSELRASSSPAKLSPTRTVTRAMIPKPIPVSTTECPLHTHLATVPLRESPECYSPKGSAAKSPERIVRRHSRTLSSDSWLCRGSKTVGGLVDLVSRLPNAYLPAERDVPLHRTTSCPPSLHRPQPAPSSGSPGASIYLLPLRPPSHPLTFPPLAVLPRSPYRPLTPPPRPTPRARFVPNPNYFRLKALQNRVLWGLVTVPRAEFDFLADVSRRHHADTYPRRPDIDRFGQMFTAREALLRFAVEGAGRSALSDARGVIGPAANVAENTRTSWWRFLV